MHFTKEDYHQLCMIDHFSKKTLFISNEGDIFYTDPISRRAVQAAFLIEELLETSRKLQKIMLTAL